MDGKPLDVLWNWWLKGGSQVGEDGEVRNAGEELEQNDMERSTGKKEIF